MMSARGAMTAFEPAAAAYLLDAAALAEEYAQRAEAIKARHADAMAEAERMAQDADSELYASARALNTEFKSKALKSAQRRAQGAEHPEDILAAARLHAATMGGPCGDLLMFMPEAPEANLAAEIARRERQEARNKEGA